ncbi:MAG: N-acetylmuramoyl-L-alanine amidase, partial [Planctomycetota bacterium]
SPPLKVEIKTTEISSGKKTIVVIAPGQGGKDPGGLSHTGKLNEKELTLAISNRVAEVLTACGIKVVFTRTTDTFIPLPERVKEVQSANCFVSIHINSNPNLQCVGYEIIHQTMDHQSEQLRQQSKLLGNQILFNLKKYIPSTRSRGLKNNVRQLHVLKNSKIPAVLLELGFISNPEEEALLNQAGYQKKLAQAIAEGIQQSLHSL